MMTYSSGSAVFRLKKASLQKIQSIGPRLSESISTSSLLEKAEKELTFLERHGITALYFEDATYPERLKECEDGPVLLYAKGDTGLNTRRALRVVGTRRVTSYGRDLCREIISVLAGMLDDLVIVSGLAYGIDVIVHRDA